MVHDRVRLVVFDLEGTLLRGHTVCEAIAEGLGRLPRMRELEALPWAQWFSARAEMASWYAGHSESHLLAGLTRLTFAPGVHEAVAWLHARGITTAICSLTWRFAVAEVAKGLGIPWYVGTDLSPEGHITHFLPEDKPVWTLALARRLGVEARCVAAVGDSAGDIPLLQAVPVGVFVGATVPPPLAGKVVHLPGADIRDVARRLVAVEVGGSADEPPPLVSGDPR